LKNRKILTAEKIIESARVLINFIEKGKIVLNNEFRDETPAIPLDILKQKYLLHKGFLMIALNKDQDACRLFTQCMVSIPNIYDFSENGGDLRGAHQARVHPPT